MGPNYAAKKEVGYTERLRQEGTDLGGADMELAGHCAELLVGAGGFLNLGEGKLVKEVRCDRDDLP